MYARF
jgi:hypothetical protein